MKKIFALSAILSIGGLMLAGCPKTEEAAAGAGNAMGDAAASAGKVTAGAAQGVANSTADAGKAAADATANAGKAVAGAADNVGAGAMGAMKDGAKALSGSLDTAKVKAAIVADSTLNDPKNDINVDTTATAVMLKGHVVNNAMKMKAGDIAAKAVKESGSNLPLKNMLLVK